MQFLGVVCFKSLTLDEVFLNRGKTSQTQLQVHLSSCSNSPIRDLQGEVNLNMNLGVLELKLHEVHFADKFSGAELARRRIDHFLA